MNTCPDSTVPAPEAEVDENVKIIQSLIANEVNAILDSAELSNEAKLEAIRKFVNEA
jgi:hypothetical protein